MPQKNHLKETITTLNIKVKELSERIRYLETNFELIQYTAKSNASDLTLKQ